MSSPAAGQTLRAGRFLLTESAQENTTYIVVDRPSGGTWKLTANAGSVPVIDVRQADGLPAPSVQAHILGSGEHRKLSWSLKAIAGQRVEFFDQGTDGGRRLIATNSPHGTVAIPAIHGHAQRRTIIALITQNGIPRQRQLVTSYHLSRLPLGKTGLLTFPWVFHRGSVGQSPASLSIARAISGRVIMRWTGTFL